MAKLAEITKSMGLMPAGAVLVHWHLNLNLMAVFT
jgi:hypothetical protein